MAFSADSPPLIAPIATRLSMYVRYDDAGDVLRAHEGLAGWNRNLDDLVGAAYWNPVYRYLLTRVRCNIYVILVVGSIPFYWA